MLPMLLLFSFFRAKLSGHVDPTSVDAAKHHQDVQDPSGSLHMSRTCSHFGQMGDVFDFMFLATRNLLKFAFI